MANSWLCDRAAGVGIAAFAYGMGVASTALVEFALLSLIFALCAVGWLIRFAVESRGLLADYRFFDAVGARLSVAGYGLVGLYAIVNAALDVGLGRYEPDWICYPATVVTAAAALIVTAAAPLRRRLVQRASGAPVWAGMRDDRLFLACCYVALCVQVTHAVIPAWWMDTGVDVVVFVFVAAEIVKIRRGPAALALHS